MTKATEKNCFSHPKPLIIQKSYSASIPLQFHINSAFLHKFQTINTLLPISFLGEKSMKIKNVFGNEYSGTIGDCITASVWKGIRYIRKWFKPTNPRTEPQIDHRELFDRAVECWQELTALQKEAYDRVAVKMSGYNLYVKRHIEDALAGSASQLQLVPRELEIPVVDEKGKAIPDATVRIMKGSRVLMEKKSDSKGICKVAVISDMGPFDIMVKKPYHDFRETTLKGRSLEDIEKTEMVMEKMKTSEKG